MSCPFICFALVLIAPQNEDKVWVECWDKRGKRKGSPESRILRRALYIELDVKNIKGVSRSFISNNRYLLITQRNCDIGHKVSIDYGKRGPKLIVVHLWEVKKVGVKKSKRN